MTHVLELSREKSQLMQRCSRVEENFDLIEVAQ
jgi:hypothetical protein